MYISYENNVGLNANYYYFFHATPYTPVSLLANRLRARTQRLFKSIYFRFPTLHTPIEMKYI